MSWPQWSSGTQPAIPSVLNPATPVINSAPAVVPPGLQYTPEQWAQLQQQNWNQWAQWQQQYQQWHQQYGAEYQKSMNALAQAAQAQQQSVSALPNVAVPPPLPIETKPPLPAEDPPPPVTPYSSTPFPISQQGYNTAAPPPPKLTEHRPPIHYPKSNQNWQSQTYPYRSENSSVKRGYDQGNDHEAKKPMLNKPGWQNPLPPTVQSQNRPQGNVEELSEAEKKFDKQFAEWEAQFNKWKEQNAEHPDKEQYREYEKKWETWRAQLLERREQMKRKRLGLTANSPNMNKSGTGQSNQAFNSPQQNFNQPPPQQGYHQPSLKPQLNTQVKSGRTSPASLPFNKPPPTLNDEPLKFKHAKLVPELEENIGDFIKPNTGGGIPGLDLVREEPQLGKKENDDVVLIDNEEREKEKKGPDFEAISKGINSILGDKNLLSMLSKVSQNQNPISNDILINTVSRIKDPNNLDQNSQLPYPEQSSQSFEEHSNHSGGFSQRELVNNFDDQTRSSFTHGDHETRFPDKFGLNQDRFGPGQDRFATGQDRFGLGQDRFGANQERLGQNQGQERFGPSQDRFGPKQDKSGLNHNRFASNQDRFGPSQDRSGFNQDRFGPGSDRFNLIQDKFGTNQERSGSNQERGGPNQNRFNSDRFVPNQDKGESGSDRFGCAQNRFGPGSDRFLPNSGQDRCGSVPNQDKFGLQQSRFGRGQDVVGSNQDRFGINQNRFEPNLNRFNNNGPNQNRFGAQQNRFGQNSDRFGTNQDRSEGPRNDDRFPSRDDKNFALASDGPKVSTYNQDQYNEYDQDYELTGNFQKSLKDNIDEPNWNKNSNYPSQKFDEPQIPAIPEAPAQPPPDEIFQPTTVIDYDHKSFKSSEPEILIEPIFMFDYRHKPLSRIPLPQRPKWLSEAVRGIREFDPPTVRPYEPPNLRRYPSGDNWRSDRYQDNWSPHNRSSYSEKRTYDDRERRTYRDRSYDEPRNFKNDWILSKRDERRSYHDDKSSHYEDKKPLFPEFEEEKISDTEWPDDDEMEQQNPESGLGDFGNFSKQSEIRPPIIKSAVLIEDLISPPGRYKRPPRIVIILRGPPGSGKTFLAKLIKDKEVENGGSAPRILSLDDYFMVEQEKEVTEDGKKVKVKEMVYEYEAEMEESYRTSLIKSFKKTITDGYFSFIIVDNVNDKVKYFGEMWSFAKQNGFQVYICQLDLDVQTCSKRNIHGRSEEDIEKCVSNWEPTPAHHPTLDATSLLQSASIPEVEMEEVNSPESDLNEHDGSEDQVARSKWDNFDCSVDNLAKLDGVNKPLRHRTMEEYLQLDNDWTPNKPTKPGQKRVRWADLEEQKEQEKMRAIGFVVGHTNWDRMMDPTGGTSALTQTKYIEKIGRYKVDQK